MTSPEQPNVSPERFTPSSLIVEEFSLGALLRHRIVSLPQSGRPSPVAWPPSTPSGPSLGNWGEHLQPSAEKSTETEGEFDTGPLEHSEPLRKLVNARSLSCLKGRTNAEHWWNPSWHWIGLHSKSRVGSGATNQPVPSCSSLTRPSTERSISAREPAWRRTCSDGFAPGAKCVVQGRPQQLGNGEGRSWMRSRSLPDPARSSLEASLGTGKVI